MPDNCVRLWNIGLEPKVSRLNQAVLNKNLMVLLSGIEQLYFDARVYLLYTLKSIL